MTELGTEVALFTFNSIYLGPEVIVQVFPEMVFIYLSTIIVDDNLCRLLVKEPSA